MEKPIRARYDKAFGHRNFQKTHVAAEGKVVQGFMENPRSLS